MDWDVLPRERVDEIEASLKDGKLPSEVLTIPELQRIVGRRFDTMVPGLVRRMDEASFKKTFEVAIEVSTTMQPIRDFVVTDVFIKDMGWGDGVIQRRVSGKVLLNSPEPIEPMSFGHAYLSPIVRPVRAWFNNHKVEAYA